MNIWDLTKDHYNWESPLTKIYGDMHNKIIRQDEENCTFVIEQALGYKVDKDELIKALQCVREQYDKGYRDGVKETVKAALEEINSEIFSEIMDSREHITYCNALNRCYEIVDKHIKEIDNGRETNVCKNNN